MPFIRVFKKAYLLLYKGRIFDRRTSKKKIQGWIKIHLSQIPFPTYWGLQITAAERVTNINVGGNWSDKILRRSLVWLKKWWTLEVNVAILE